MKFGKRLRIQMEDTLPEWRSKFLSYKQLKKRLKSLRAPECFTEAACDGSTSPELALGQYTSKVHSPAKGKVTVIVPPERLNILVEGKDSRDTAALLKGILAVIPGQSQKPISESTNEPTEVASGSRKEAECTCGERASESIPNCIGGDQSAAQVDQHSESVARKDQEVAGQRFQEGSELSTSLVSQTQNGSGDQVLSKEDTEFIQLLNRELEKFNSFFIEKEEDYVIRLQELKERIDAISSENGGKLSFRGAEVSQEVLDIRQEIVNFHGEMVLLENYSSLNYMGLVKIIKKHDKRMGTVLRLPFIQQVLRQPFFTTELLAKLVRECEAKLQIVFPSSADEGQASAWGSVGNDLAELGGEEKDNDDVTTELKELLKSDLQLPDGDLSLSLGEDVDCIYRSTLAALKTLQEMRVNIEAAVTTSRANEDNHDSGASGVTKAPVEEGFCDGTE